MPRKNGNLDPLSSGSRGIGRAIYRNKLDTLNTILTPGYFNDDWTLLRDIDLMDIVASDGTMTARIAAGTRFVLVSPFGTGSATRSSNVVAGIGDSTVDQMTADTPKRNFSAYNHVPVGNALAENRIARLLNFGKSGDRTDQTLARLPAALASGAGVLYISEGINSFAQAPYVHAVTGLTISAAEVGASAFADTLQKIDAGLALGMSVIVALCHGAENYTAAQIKQMVIYNAAIRRAAEVRPNVWILDSPAILHDPTTTPNAIVFRTNYMRAGEATRVHEGTLGAYFVGKAFALILREVMRLLPRNNVDGTNQRANGLQLLNNPFFNATTGNAGVLGAGATLAGGTAAAPREWNFNRQSGDTTCNFTVGVEPNAQGNGNDLVIAATATVPGTGVRVSQDLAGTPPNGDFWMPGAVLQGFSKIAVISGATGLASVNTQIEMNGTLDGVSTTQTTHALLGDVPSGLFPSTEGFNFDLMTEQMLVPAYSARAYLSFKALNLVFGTAGSATVRVNMPQMSVLSTLV